MSYTDEDRILEDIYVADLINKLDDLWEQSHDVAVLDIPSNKPLDYAKDD